MQSDLGWSERVNWYGRQRVVLLRKTKTHATESAPGPIPDCWDLVMCKDFLLYVGIAAVRVKSGTLVSRFQLLENTKLLPV